MKVFILILAGFSANAFSCRTVAQRMLEYPMTGTNQEKVAFLKSEGCGNPKYYAPRETDRVIAWLLNDAIDSGIEDSVIVNVLKTFNCVKAAKNTEWYPKISNYIKESGLSSFCYGERARHLYIVNAVGGINLRSEPSRTASKTGTIAEGLWVIVKHKDGLWALIESEAGEGYVYFPLLSKY